MHESVPVWLEWIPPASGGRRAPPPGPIYAPTARFEDEPLSEMFSVVFKRLDEPIGDGLAANWTMSILVPENLPNKVARVASGVTLIVHEGRQAVAKCVVMAACLSPVAVGS